MPQNTYPAKSIVQNSLLVICIACIFLFVTGYLSLLSGLSILVLSGITEFIRNLFQSEPSTYEVSDRIPDWVLRSVPESEWEQLQDIVSGSVVTEKMALMYIVREVRFITLISFGAIILWGTVPEAVYIIAGMAIGVSLLRLGNGLTYSIYKPVTSDHIGTVYSVDTETTEKPTALQEYVSTQLDRLDLPPIEIKQVPSSSAQNDYSLFISQKRVPKLYYGTSIFSSTSDDELSKTVKHGIMHEIGHLTSVRYLLAKYLLRISQSIGIFVFILLSESLLIAGLAGWGFICITQLLIRWVSRREEYYSDAFSARETEESVESHIFSLLEPIEDEHNPFDHPPSLLWTLQILVSSHPPIESRIKRLIELEKTQE